jgi:hypothetical protein
MIGRHLIDRQCRLRAVPLAVAAAAVVLAIPLAGIATAQEGSGGGAPGGGAAGGGVSPSSGDGAWPPTEVAWPPTGGPSSSSDGAGDDSTVSSVLPTPIVLPGGPPILPDGR